MGEVWSARHIALQTIVAVKFLSAVFGACGTRMALDRFRFEGQVSAHLAQETQHVVAVHDAGVDVMGPFIVMEHINGRTLRAELNAGGPLPPRVVASIVDQVGEALSVAHARGIVHRDLKPSNLLLVDGPCGYLRVKVADFGIAKALRSDLAVDLPGDTSNGLLVGSPAYMSPEQIARDAVEPESDLWSLAVIAYEAITGRMPFPARSLGELIHRLATGRYDVPTSFLPGLPTAFDRWCGRAFAKRKEKRFRTATQLAAALREAVSGIPSHRLSPRARHPEVLSGGTPKPSSRTLPAARTTASESTRRG